MVEYNHVTIESITKKWEIGLLKNNARIKVLVSCLKNSETILDFGFPTRLSGKRAPDSA